MSEIITINKASFVALLGDLFLPAGDGDPYDPDNPINPVILQALRHLVWLNSQPLPPKELPDSWRLRGPFPHPWRLAGPVPQPWGAAVLARMAIDQLVAEARLAEVGERPEAGHDATRARLAQLVDEFCGNRPPRWPLPWPWPPKFDAARLRPLDLLVIGAQFQKAADAMADNPLQADFSAAADQLLETGVQRLDSNR